MKLQNTDNKSMEPINCPVNNLLTHFNSYVKGK